MTRESAWDSSLSLSLSLSRSLFVAQTAWKTFRSTFYAARHGSRLSSSFLSFFFFFFYYSPPPPPPPSAFSSRSFRCFARRGELGLGGRKGTERRKGEGEGTTPRFADATEKTRGKRESRSRESRAELKKRRLGDAKA